MINTVHVGIGPLGQKVLRYAVERGCFNVVGAVDPDPEKVGKDLGQLCGIESLGVTVRDNLADAINGKSVDVALLTTVSSLVALESQVAGLADAKLNIVSTCEELFYPWKTSPEVAGRIDEKCRQNGVACVGTGVNPGYLMDLLPTVLSGLCQNVKKVEVWRVQDASVRRIPFQQKIGAGLTMEQFEAMRDAGTLRHVGLPESVGFIAERLGFPNLSNRSSQKVKSIPDTNQSLKVWPAACIKSAGVLWVTVKSLLCISERRSASWSPTTRCISTESQRLNPGSPAVLMVISQRVL